jgi:hypothetical protein
MKNLIVILAIISLFATQAVAQLQSNESYSFTKAVAISRGNVNHTESQFNFQLIGDELYWQELNEEVISLGAVPKGKKITHENGFYIVYKMSNVKLLYAEDDRGVTISILYAGREIIFHNNELNQDIAKG